MGRHGKRCLARIIILFFFAVLFSGCDLITTRVIVVPAGKPFLLAQDLHNVKIMTKDADGQLIELTAKTIHCSGWIVAPLKDKGPINDE